MNYYIYTNILDNFVLTCGVSNSGLSYYSPCIDPLSYEVWLEWLKYLYVHAQIYIYISLGGRDRERQTDRRTDKQIETDRQTDR